MFKNPDFGNANLGRGTDDWIDVQTIADLEEVSFDIRSKRNARLRGQLNTQLNQRFSNFKGVTQYKLIPSLVPLKPIHL